MSLRAASTVFTLAARSALFILCGLLIVTVVGLIALRIDGKQLLSVQSSSMVPAFHPGDALIVEPAKPAQLRVGDIISYQSFYNPGVVVTHRLIAVDKQTGWLTTAGDALHNPDPVFPPGQLVGRATALAPGLGLVIDMLRRPLGLALFVYLPAAAIISLEARRLSRAYARPFYSVRL